MPSVKKKIFCIWNFLIMREVLFCMVKMVLSKNI